MIHSLSDRSPEARTATCSVCGPVRIQRAGNGWACGKRANATNQASKRRRPRPKSEGANPHRLSERDIVARTATCAECGPVSIEPWARGWICSSRARALGRVVTQAAPQEHCSDCKVADGVLVWLTDGACLRCAETDLNAMLAKHFDDEKIAESFGEDFWESGLHLEGVVDPYYVPDYESAVPGWRTIG